ncbi:MAG: hypothetical protein MUF37_04190 [Methanoregulaceae archaeon]|jgi:hypothetical protein|nr:hypothetical protein [Methanoregulaceae archaeon]
MKRKQIAIIVAGLIISALLAVISIYLTGIGVILVIVLAMSFQIFEDSYLLTDLAVVLSGNAKKITVINRGNTTILNIVVSLIPLDMEFKVPELAVEGKFTYELQQMIHEAKAMVEFEDRKGTKFSKSFDLSALHDNDDVLKPMFPIFGWKEK